jgi:hypothetical protein
MKIQMIRHTQEKGLIADVWLCKTSILTVSIPVEQCTYEALIDYALTDPEHILNAELEPEFGGKAWWDSIDPIPF